MMSTMVSWCLKAKTTFWRSSLKLVFLNILWYSQENNCAETLTQAFSVNTVDFLLTTFLQNTSCGCFCKGVPLVFHSSFVSLPKVYNMRELIFLPEFQKETLRCFEDIQNFVYILCHMQRVTPKIFEIKFWNLCKEYSFL